MLPAWHHKYVAGISCWVMSAVRIRVALQTLEDRCILMDLKVKGQPYLPKHLSTWWPAETLTKPIHEPKHGKHHDSGWPGKGNVYGAHNEEPDGEEPASTDLVRKHSADKLTDSIGQSLAAGDQPCITGNRKNQGWNPLDALQIWLLRIMQQPNKYCIAFHLFD